MRHLSVGSMINDVEIGLEDRDPKQSIVVRWLFV